MGVYDVTGWNLIEYKKKNILLKGHAENRAGGLQSAAEYLGLALVFVWDGALRRGV